MRHKPTRAKPTDVTEWNAGAVQRRADDLVTEEPLEIRVDGQALTVTMRTPGDDVELAAGLLYTEGVITSRENLASIDGGAETANVVEVVLADARSRRAPSDAPPHIMSSACGICGKASIDEIRARGLSRINSTLVVDASILVTLPDKLRHAQSVFDRTGALHAAGLFDASGNLLLIREDVGRHNAVDKIIGASLLAPPALPAHLALPASVLLVSGRAGFEIVQKAVVAGIPIVASVSAPTSLSVQCAREFGLTLVGFLRGDRFVVYSGDKRITLQSR